MPLRLFVICALLWGVGYLIWRFGWSGEGANPVLFAMLLVTEVYGLWALGTLAWYPWSRPVLDASVVVGERPAVLLELENAAGDSTRSPPRSRSAPAARPTAVTWLG